MPEIPDRFRGTVRAVFHFVLKTICDAHGTDVVKEGRAWKMLLLLPRLLLRPTSSTPGNSHRDELRARIAKFWAGDWTSLLEQCVTAKHKQAQCEGKIAEKLMAKNRT